LLQVLIAIFDVDDFPKILTCQHLKNYNFAFVIDNKIKLAFRDWQYTNYVEIKNKLGMPIFVYDYKNFAVENACSCYRKSFYYFEIFEKFNIWKPVVITSIDYVQHSNMFAEKIHNMERLHDGILLDDDLAVAFYWYMAMRFCHAVDDRINKKVERYNQLDLLELLEKGEHDELPPMPYGLVEL
jgi:hypothetical protein